jgi:hypothetical protein
LRGEAEIPFLPLIIRRFDNLGFDLQKAAVNSDNAAYITSGGKVVKFPDVLDAQRATLQPTPMAGNQTIAITSSAVVSLTVPTGAYSVWIYPSVAINCWLDGTVPTTGAVGTGTGFPIAAGEKLKLDYDEATGFKVIAQANSGVLIVMYER